MRLLVLALTLVASTSIHALTYTSRVEQVPLVELYTSQGCSSCPPADRWLSRLKSHPGLWRELVPLAFHVDYWDHIGWEDPFADPRNSARQGEYRNHGRVGSVYTPGFVIGGREWKGFFRGGQLSLPPTPKVGRMRLELTGDSQARIEFEPMTSDIPEPLTLHIVRLGFGLTTEVARGENAGRELREDFVVLGWRSKEVDLAAGSWELPLPEPSGKPERQAVAAWLSASGSPVPLQAVAGWLP